ncbi:MAG: hypothetical protein OCD01_12985 [Fibrobacterales bacterium]
MTAVLNNIREQWSDNHTQSFTLEERAHVTVLSTGLPENTIKLLRAALKPVGIRFRPLETPGNKALEFGKEYGNRGQCNPTYFTVGSLIQQLVYLRDEKKIPIEDIKKNYVFMTAGGCGPCRMGMYATEYRKALRDSGFEGFRVILLTRSGEVSSEQSSGLDMTKRELIRIFTSILFADVINVMHKRLRTYEVEKGTADRAADRCRNVIQKALQKKKSLLVAAWKCRKILKKVKTDKLQVRPKVLIQGEFWAKTTEGDGNYDLYRFLENEGAEPVIETITDWLLHQMWRARWEADRRLDMSFQDSGDGGLDGVNIKSLKRKLWIGDRIMRGIFYSLGYISGLRRFHLTDHDALGEVAHEYIDNHLDGGEDNMEIGHHINTFEHNHANMVLSVKPFTCLSSNGVSDGIQPIISEKYPNSIFVSVETNGDAPANFYSRVQMQLFKAKQAAQNEVDRALEMTGLTMEKAYEILKKDKKLNDPLYVSPHAFACPAANLILELGGMPGKREIHVKPVKKVTEPKVAAPAA